MTTPTGATRHRRSFGRQHGPAAIGLLASLVIAVAAGPSIADRIDDGLHRDITIVPLEPVDSAAAPTGTDAPAPGPPGPAAPVPGEATPGSTSRSVVKIQTVPAMSDVLLEIDGRRVATDATGAVSVSADEADASVRVIGPVADPPLQTLDFAMWSDGSTEIERSLTTIDGPVAVLGLEVGSRVLVAADDGTRRRTVATFTSALGPVDIAVGVPTWVPAAVVVRTPDGLASEPVAYELAEVASSDVPDAQVFAPTPEATWRITT